MKPGDLAELVRLPAALTVPGDVFAGAAAAGWPLGWRTTALPVASTCLYWAGMALNDYADRDLDRVERPERSIPSGRVSPGQALAVATGLTAAGVGAAALAGGRPALTVAVPLAGVVWTYDLWAKQNASGPAVMAAARGLDVLLGGTGGRWRDTALPVAAVATHTAAVTGLSRGEVHGGSQRAGLGAAAGTAAAAAIAAMPTRRQVNRPSSEQPWVNPQWSEQPRVNPQRSEQPWVNPQWSEQPWVNPQWSEQPRVNPQRSGDRRVASPISRWAGPALAATYAVTVGARQLAAARRPDAQTVRTATGAGVRGVIPLQAALTARKGALAVAAGLLAAGPVAKLASKVVSPT